MPIITISRGSKSGGKALAEMVAEKLNCPNVISREVLIKASEEYGIDDKEMIAAMHAPPSFWSRSTRTMRRLYLTFVRATLYGFALEDCMVYHGNAGHFLLSEVDWVLKIRLIAPIEYRIHALQQSIDIDRFAAIQYINKADDDRRRWTKFLYNEDWSDPAHFDLIINLKTTSLESASDTICRLANSSEFERTPERVMDLTNKALAAKVQAVLEANPRTREADINIRAENSIIYLSGQIAHKDLIDEVLQVVSKVDNVSEVKYQP